MVCLQFEKWVKNLGMGWPLLNFLTKQMQHIIFYACVHTCSPSNTDQE